MSSNLVLNAKTTNFTKSKVIGKKEKEETNLYTTCWSKYDIFTALMKS